MLFIVIFFDGGMKMMIVVMLMMIEIVYDKVVIDNIYQTLQQMRSIEYSLILSFYLLPIVYLLICICI